MTTFRSGHISLKNTSASLFIALYLTRFGSGKIDSSADRKTNVARELRPLDIYWNFSAISLQESLF
jgi:hypothetical protein